MKNNKYLICVYGSLKKGFHNSRLLEQAVFLGKYLTEPSWTLLSLGSFPALIKAGTTSIHTEVYEVDKETRDRVYLLEGYSGVRDSPNNWYDTTDVITPYGTAEVFYMKNESQYKNNRIVEDGIWR